MNDHLKTAKTNPPENPVEDKHDIFGKENKSLINLAIKCRFLPIAREKEVLNILAEKRIHSLDYSVIELFREKEFLSEENIEFLFAVKEHLETKMLDKRFGELGVANQFIQPESVKKALDIQNNLFKKTNKSKLIGDILLENKEISKADQSAILLSQDRIKDELLAEAMNDIAKTEIEKISLNMRFGAIAVKKKMIDLGQLNQALGVQEAEVKSGQERRHLSTIFKQLFKLSDAEINYILQIQKELEKKRLSLEKALSQYNDQTSINKRLSKQFEYRFSKNKLEAFLQKKKEGFEEIRVQNLVAWLNSIGITWGLCPESTMTYFLTGAKIGMEIQIAKGLPPKKGEDESNEFFFDTDFSPMDENETDQTDENAGNKQLIPLVKKGDALARSIPLQKGTPGKDVCGFSIPAPPPQTSPLNCGEGVKKQKEVFLAETDGIPLLYKGRTLFVKAREQTIPTLHHTGKINTDLGNKYRDVNLKVEGSIFPGGAIRCQGLEISGDLLGQVSAAGDIRITGSIGQATNSEDNQARIKAEGDIFVNKAVTNAIIVTSKSLLAPKADLVSSVVLAYQDIVLKNVSHNGTKPSILQTGKNPNLKAEGLDNLINSHTEVLNKLRHQNQLDKLEKDLNTKLQVKEDFLKQHEVLKFLLAVQECEALLSVSSLGGKLTKIKKEPESFKELPQKPLLEGAAAKFLDKFLSEADTMEQATLKAHLTETADIKYGMYKAAVNATQRHQHEYETKKKIVLGKVALKKQEITQKEEFLKRLTIRKDTLLLGQAYRPQPVPPVIKVKNKVQKGTVIMGQKARRTMDQDIYGVKFMEIQETPREAPVITIEGLYD
jgi:uncharacterized protein (DUF342 family)